VLNGDNPAWDSKVTLFRLPPLVRILLADVDAGSDTPSLVGRVLKWRQSSSEEGMAFERLNDTRSLVDISANTVWNDLNIRNQELINRLNNLSEMFIQDPSSYGRAFRKLVTYPPSQVGPLTYSFSKLKYNQWSATFHESEAEVSIMQLLYDVHQVTEVKYRMWCNNASKLIMTMSRTSELKLGGWVV
jgi:phosphomevalonate kinase